MARVSIFLITVALIVGMAGCGPLRIEIHDWYDLDAIRDNLGGSYILTNDLDSTTAGYEELASPTANEGKGWQPIGFSVDLQFSGTFNGQGYEIRDLFIDRPDEDPVGLFGIVDEAGYIEDIGVVNATVISNECVGGGLVGVNYGTVSNSYFTGSVTGIVDVGGLVGVNCGTVSNSYSSGSVTANYTAGGLVGNNYKGTVSNSYSTGSVTGYMGVGGLVAFNGGTLSNSYFTGSVTGYLGVGGLVAVNNGGIISNSYYNYDEVLINGENIITIGALFGEDFEQWLANNKFLNVNERLSQEDSYYVLNNVTDFQELLAFGQDGSLKFRLKNDLDLATEPNFYIPYLAGEFDGNGHKISNLSFNFYFVSHVGLFGYLAPGGKVTQVGVKNVNITGASLVGGLVGANWEGTVSNSYSSGSVNGSATSKTISYEEYIGGLVGFNSEGTVSNSYSSGSVTGKEYVGGLTGYNWGTVSNSYSTANVTGDLNVGGLVAMNPGTVDSSYSTGSVTGNMGVGGLVANDYGIVSNSFWDMETSGQATSDGGTGKTTAEMQDIATFSGAGWNICAVAPDSTNTTYIWNIINGVTYPFLSWEL